MKKFVEPEVKILSLILQDRITADEEGSAGNVIELPDMTLG